MNGTSTPLTVNERSIKRERPKILSIASEPTNKPESTTNTASLRNVYLLSGAELLNIIFIYRNIKIYTI